VPVITGIGHEPDTTIADMVADVRASTPTAAAERVAPSHDEILLHLEGLKTRLVNAQRRRLDTAALRVNQLAALPPLREPQRLFENEALALDDLAMRLSRALPASLERDTHHLNRLHDALAHSLPRLLMLPQSRVSAAQHRLGLLGPTLSVPFKHRTQQLVERLQRAADSGFEPYEARLSLQASRLHDLSPLTVLARGYSITRTEDGALVSSIERVNEGDKLNIAVSDGTVSATVDSTHVRKVSL
jgi:exodeoxyribonuclease VII large subunit